MKKESNAQTILLIIAIVLFFLGLIAADIYLGVLGYRTIKAEGYWAWFFSWKNLVQTIIGGILLVFILPFFYKN